MKLGFQGSDKKVLLCSMAKAWLEKQETKLSDNEKKLEGIS